MPSPPCLSVSLSLLALSLLSPPALGAPGGALSFLALGDWGGLPEPPFVTPRQVATAAAMGRAATELGGDFVLALGDNFYYEGVKDEWDPRFQDTFERVFVSPGLRGVPWFVMAGNHDHAGNVTAQLRYSRHSPRWHFPHPYYSLRLLGCPCTVPALSLHCPRVPGLSPNVPRCPQVSPLSPGTFPTRTTACACTCRAPTSRRGCWCWTRFCSAATATISVPAPAPVPVRAPRGPGTRRRPRRTWAGCGRSWRRRRATPSCWWPGTTRCGRWPSTAPRAAWCGCCGRCCGGTASAPTCAGTTTTCSTWRRAVSPTS
ncbi:tartrate-resistant acid phosphatase type 5 isoform X2 [Zonotrichia albicollis]|uniref:tartrate-resistant acid phosphatase type 5 isoform X2 n=1 Tax=Zonotrichia albicollis TaxID=44394 RepID=UPI003D811115